MAFSLSAVSSSTIFESGGYEIQVQGSFDLEHRYKIHIGSNGSSVDPACQSGRVEQGTIIFPWTESILRAYSPVIAPGGPYTVTVVDQDTAEEHQLVDAVSVAKRQFVMSVYDLRKVLPRFYKTGPRKIDAEPL